MSNSSVEMLLINGYELDVSKDMCYNKPKVNSKGGKNVPIRNNNSKKALYISTPLLMTWGVNQNDYDGNGNFTYDFSLAFPRKDDPNYSEKTEQFLKAMQSFEDKIVEDAYQNRKDWFGKSSMSKEVLQALFSPMLKYPKNDEGEPDKSRQPTLPVKIPYYNGEFKCEMYDDNENNIFPSNNDTVDNGELIQKLVQKTQNVAVLMECRGIWFASGKFGVTWGLVQAVVKPLITLKGKCHLKLDVNEKKLLSKQSAEEDSNKNNAHSVEDSDEDNDDQENSTLQELEPKKEKKSVKRNKKK